MAQRYFKSSLFAGAAIAAPLVGLTAPPVHAQPVPAQTAKPTSENADISSIVITANKREERLNKVGLTVSAISGQTLEERKIGSLSDIAAVVPGLSFAPSPSNTPILTIRGVGYNSAALGSAPAVTTFIDQQPLTFPVLALHSAYDLQRIEVLKGPQGTLFGANSTGGAMNFIANKPTSDFQGGGDISFGRFNRVEGNAYLSGPLSKTLRARLAVTGLNMDGWQYSASRPSDRNAKQSYVAGRLLLDWDASDTIHFEVNLNAWNDRSQPQAPQFIALYPSSPARATPQELTAPLISGSPRIADWTAGDLAPHSDRNFRQASLRGDIDLTESIKLTSLTSYVHYKQIQAQEFDGTPYSISDYGENGRISDFNQEIRFDSASGSRLRWVLGANFAKNETVDLQHQLYPLNSVSFLIKGSDAQTSERRQNYAAFGNVEFDITPALTAKLGARYTHSRDQGSLCVGDAGDGSLAAFFNVLGARAGIPFTPVGVTGPIDQRCVTINASGVPSLTPIELTLKEHNVSWRGGLDYRLSNSMLLYVNVSRGYKAGAFPVVGATSYLQFAPVKQESVTAYEGGVKTDLFDHLVHVDGAIFYYDYGDKQVLGKRITPPFGPQTVLVNVPKSEVYGFDGDISIRPVRELTLNGSLTYLHTRIVDYIGFNAFGIVNDFRGAWLPFAPMWSYAADAEYRHRLPNGGAPFVGVSVQGQSKQDTTINGHNLPFPTTLNTRILPGLVYPFTTPAFATVDARLGYEAPSHNWTAMVWAKNIFNKYYWTNISEASEAKARFAGMPATYGATLTVKFK